MASDGKVEALRSVRFFEGCSERELRQVAQLCTRIDVGEGFVFTVEGAHGDECFIIGDGSAEVTRGGWVIDTVGRGECVGELALLDHGRRTATVTALTPMTVYAVSGTEFRALLDENAVAKNILMTATKHLQNRG
jgi:CRP-like cAMP-binding protein